MRSTLSVLLIATIFLACKTDPNLAKAISIETKIDAEKIAEAHGFKNWDKVSKIQFTFNVDSDGNHFERSWSWNPKTNDVSMLMAGDTIQYNRESIDSLSLNADRAFINDKYWLLVPFQLVWDTSASITQPIRTQAPISKDSLSKITISYGSEGGYTPGDAYDIFYNDEFLIKEWIYRKANGAEPSLISTFENYTTINGIKFAQEHKKADANWNLNFTDIIIEQ